MEGFPRITTQLPLLRRKMGQKVENFVENKEQGQKLKEHALAFFISRCHSLESVIQQKHIIFPNYKEQLKITGSFTSGLND